MDDTREALKQGRRGPKEFPLGVCGCMPASNQLAWNEKGGHKTQLKNVRYNWSCHICRHTDRVEVVRPL